MARFDNLPEMVSGVACIWEGLKNKRLVPEDIEARAPRISNVLCQLSMLSGVFLSSRGWLPTA